MLSGGINQKVIQSICQQRVLDGNCQYIFRDILTGVTGVAPSLAVVIYWPGLLGRYDKVHVVFVGRLIRHQSGFLSQ